MRTAAGTALLAAVLVIVGALSPWFSFSLLGVTAHIKGTDHSLHGRSAVALGIAAFVLAVVGVVFGDRRRLRAVLIAAFALIGAVGLGLMRHQARYLNTDARARMRASGLGLFDQYFGQRTTTAWGFWLVVAGFITLLVLPPSTYLAVRVYNRRSAPPSTGITQPVRYDAAGDSANAAT